MASNENRAGSAQQVRTVRAFIAVELDSGVLQALDRLQTALRKRIPAGVVRWVKSDGIHLTLKFLGNVPSDQLPEIKASLQRAARVPEPFTVTCSGVGCFPNPSRPRVVWVGVEEPSGNLARLQAAVETEVAPLGYPTEARPFSPHLTLGRAQRDASKSELHMLGDMIVSQRIGKLAQMDVLSVSLIRSDLRSTGAVYTPLAHVPLGPVS